MDNNATTVEQQYLDEALFLAKSYGFMLKDRDRLKKMLDGSWEYTIDDTIAEMDSITVSYDRERVQSSNISNPVERIVMKTTDPVFMARKQREKDQLKKWCEQTYKYTLWKINIVDTAIRERMSTRTRGVFKKCFVEGWTYEHMRESYNKALLDNKQIAREKRKALFAVYEQVMTVHSFEAGTDFEKRLAQEALEMFAVEEEKGNGKDKENPAAG